MRNVLACLLLQGSFILLSGCQDSQPSITEDDLQKRLSQLESKTLSNMAFIEGGTFTMGDFGAVGDDGVWRPYFPPTIEEDTPHVVTLSNYSLSRHKTTWEEFDTYLIANDLPVFERNYADKWERDPFITDDSSAFFINKPAKVTWHEAKAYCGWLGQRIGSSLSLPTSAQWEYAGRNRGSQDWIFSTHDGKPLSAHYKLAEMVQEGGEYVPIGSRLPPNPLGIYDMADNGKEWVNDWFSETYYRENPRIVDPEGPVEGTKRTVRNLDFSFSRIGVSESTPSIINKDWTIITTNTFRCALQSKTPLAESHP